MLKVVTVVVKFKISRSRNKVLLGRKLLRQPWWQAVRGPEAPACGCGKTLYPLLRVICGSLRNAVNTALSAGSQGWTWNFLVLVRMFAPVQRCPLAQKAWCQERTHGRALRSGQECARFLILAPLLRSELRGSIAADGISAPLQTWQPQETPYKPAVWKGCMWSELVLWLTECYWGKKTFLFHLMLVEVFKSLGFTYLFCNVIKNVFQSFFFRIKLYSTFMALA